MFSDMVENGEVNSEDKVMPWLCQHFGIEFSISYLHAFHYRMR